MAHSGANIGQNQTSLGFLRKILAFLIFVPNITLGTNTPGLGRPEIFPWAGFYAVRKDIRLTIR